MIINNGPIGSAKFDPLKDLLIKYGTQTEYSNITTSGVANIYNFYQTGKYWALLIYSDCSIQLNKKLSKASIGAVGGGGGGGCGGGHSGSLNWGYPKNSAGGGGGGGGQIVINNKITLSSQNYKIEIGQGGAGSTTVQTADWVGSGENWKWVTSDIKHGADGNATKLILLDTINTLILSAAGGYGGKTAPVSYGYVDYPGVRYTCHSSSGAGGSQYIAGGAGGYPSNNGVSGSSERVLFDLSLLGKGEIKVSGGGGGGGGGSESGNTSAGTNGGASYGAGGHGGTRGATDVENGKNGLLIIRNY